MKENIELLQYIYQIAKMRLAKIDNIKHNIEDNELSTLIKEQEKKYFEITTLSTELLNNMNQEPKEISNISKILTFMNAKISTTNDSSNSNIAKMMIVGTNQDILEIQEKINRYDGKNNKIIKLANKLLEIEKYNIETMNKYI